MRLCSTLGEIGESRRKGGPKNTSLVFALARATKDKKYCSSGAEKIIQQRRDQVRKILGLWALNLFFAKDNGFAELATNIESAIDLVSSLLLALKHPGGNVPRHMAKSETLTVF